METQYLTTTTAESPQKGTPPPATYHLKTPSLTDMAQVSSEPRASMTREMAIFPWMKLQTRESMSSAPAMSERQSDVPPRDSPQ